MVYFTVQEGIVLGYEAIEQRAKEMDLPVYL